MLRDSHQDLRRQAEDRVEQRFTQQREALFAQHREQRERDRHAQEQAMNRVAQEQTRLAEQKRELERFLYQRVYRHERIILVRIEAQARLKAIFDGFVAKPHLLPERYRQRAQVVGLERSVGDYLAGMTDRFCDAQYERLRAS